MITATAIDNSKIDDLVRNRQIFPYGKEEVPITLTKAGTFSVN